MDKTLGQFIKNKRELTQLTLRQVEDLTGIKNAYLSQLENGKIKRPSPEVLKKLSDVFRTPYDLLLELTGYPVQMPTTNSVIGVAEEFRTLSIEEEGKLLEYLKFLRSQRNEK